METKRIALATDFGRRLVDAGLIPSMCKRVVIDLSVEQIATIYYTTCGTVDVLDEVIKGLLVEGHVPLEAEPGIVDTTTFSTTETRTYDFAKEESKQ